MVAALLGGLSIGGSTVTQYKVSSECLAYIQNHHCSNIIIIRLLLLILAWQYNTLSDKFHDVKQILI